MNVQRSPVLTPGSSSTTLRGESDYIELLHDGTLPRCTLASEWNLAIQSELGSTLCSRVQLRLEAHDGVRTVDAVALLASAWSRRLPSTLTVHISSHLLIVPNSSVPPMLDVHVLYYLLEPISQ